MQLGTRPVGKFLSITKTDTRLCGHVDHSLSVPSDWLRASVHVNPLWVSKPLEWNCPAEAWRLSEFTTVIPVQVSQTLHKDGTLLPWDRNSVTLKPNITGVPNRWSSATLSGKASTLMSLWIFFRGERVNCGVKAFRLKAIDVKSLHTETLKIMSVTSVKATSVVSTCPYLAC